MGIRFYCPNGHKLNVKSFLAGKRGICPKCGVKLVIPEASAPDLAEATNKSPTGHKFLSDDANKDTAPAKTVAKSQSEDDAHWYLCPPSGGQYGPVNTETMDEWIEDGRVTSDSLVWRNGWADWKSAGQVFPSLPKPKAAKVEAAASTETPVLLESSTATKTRKRKAERTTMTAVVLLILAAILLSGALYLAL